MNTPITHVIKQASDYIYDQAYRNEFGDITVTVTMKDGVPVKLTTSFCTHFVQRQTNRVTVEK